MNGSIRMMLSPRLWSVDVKRLVVGGLVAAMYPGVFAFLDFYSGLGGTRYLWHGPFAAALAFCATVGLGACVGLILGRAGSFLYRRAHADR